MGHLLLQLTDQVLIDSRLSRLFSDSFSRSLWNVHSGLCRLCRLFSSRGSSSLFLFFLRLAATLLRGGLHCSLSSRRFDRHFCLCFSLLLLGVSLFCSFLLSGFLFCKQRVEGRFLGALSLLGSLGVKALALATRYGIYLIGVFLGNAGTLTLGTRHTRGRVLGSLIENSVDDALQLVVLVYLDTQFVSYFHQFGDGKLF